jgi:ABC-type antimicrobial peptide transport system permease subunit
MAEFQSISFSLKKEDFAESSDGNVSFQGIAYSGDAIDRYFGMMAIDLANAKVSKNKVNLLWAHDEYALPVGSAYINVSDDIYITNGSIYNSPNIPNAKGLNDLVAAGHELQLSIGVSGSLETFEKPKEVFINNKTQVVSAVLRSISIDEISFVNTPADSKTYVQKMNKYYSKENEDKLNFSEKKGDFMSEQKTEDLTAEDIAALKSEILNLKAEAAAFSAAAKKREVELKFAAFSLSAQEIDELAASSDVIQQKMLVTLQAADEAQKNALKPNSKIHEFSKDKNKKEEDVKDFGIFKFNTQIEKLII